jgi:hypothetical protein
MFFGVIRKILHFYTSGAGSFAFKSSFSYRIFRFSCLAVVSPGRKMAPKFVQVYGAHTQDIFLLFMSIITENPVKKNGAKS